MENWKLYVSSGIFVAVTVLKLLMPDLTASAREELVSLIDMDMDYQGMVMQVGRVLTEDPAQQVVELVRRGRWEVSGWFTTRPTASPGAVLSASPSPVPTAAPTPAPLLERTPEPENGSSEASNESVSDSVLAAVEAFQTAQEAYVDYDTPDTVSYDQLQIPFSYTSPISGVKSSGFGYRVHPIEGVVRFHYGTDYAADTGTPIVAFADGQVTMTGFEKGFGNYVEVTHADGWKTLYAHCSEVKVHWWQTVEEGEEIALAGETGEATGPHLHLELTHEGFYTNPEFFF